MKSLNNAKFKEIANILIDEYGKARVPLEDVIKDYMNKLDCSRELAFEEYVCDCMTKMLSDTNAAETLAKLRIADSKIADGFIKYIHKAIKGIKAFIKNKDDKQLGNLTLQLNQLQHIADLWAEGVAGAMTEFENKQNKKTALDNDGEIKYSIAENTESDIDKLLNNKYYRDEIKLSNTTPSIMLAQKGVKNLPLIMNAGHIRENILTEDEARQKGFKISNKIHYYGLGKELFLKIFDELENTKLAYRGTKNASNPTRRENYFLLISEIKDEKNNIINVPVYINEKTKSNNVFIDVNKAATAYGKANFNKYIDNQLKSGNLVRIKNNRPSEWTESLPADYRSVVDNNTLPHTSEKVKVENENAEKFSKKGENKYGIEVYETSEEVKKLTWKERIKQYKNLMENMFYGRTARFNRNGHIYYAQFDKDSTDKILYGEKGLSTKGKKAIIKAGADGDVFNVVENAKYDHSGKDLKNHKSKDNFTDYFDYFYKTVQIDNGVYDIIINVKK